jgi:DNA-binding NtrC family response regulator
LPRVDEGGLCKLPQPAAAVLTGTETVLLVEDDVRLRSAVNRMLEKQGYRVLLAANGAEARASVREYGGPIHVLLTDVVMPGENGPALALDVRESAGCKVLFMSGYTDHAALHAGVLEPGVNFLQKPFGPGALARKLREVLDG